MASGLENIDILLCHVSNNSVGFMIYGNKTLFSPSTSALHLYSDFPIFLNSGNQQRNKYQKKWWINVNK